LQLSELGISHDQSSDWQKVASLSDEELEREMALGASTGNMTVMVRDRERPAPMTPVTPVSHEALWLWGQLNDFRRDGLLDRAPAEVMSTMTEALRKETVELAPLELPTEVVATSTGLASPPSSQRKNGWRSGASLQTSGTLQWWIGDWWAYGEHRYAERKAVVEADEWGGPSFQTCADCGTIACAFETSRRREVLAFSFHKEVVSLPPAEADLLLDETEQDGLTVRANAGPLARGRPYSSTRATASPAASPPARPRRSFPSRSAESWSSNAKTFSVLVNFSCAISAN
jgi:hypothetical protein